MWHGCWKCPLATNYKNYLACQLALYIYWLTNQFGDCLAVAVEMLTGGIGIGFFVG